MSFLKYGLIGLVVLTLLAISALAFLGMQSRNGTALGLVDGQLAACPTSPNCVSSEIGTEDEKKTDPLPLSAWDKLPAEIAALGGQLTSETETYISAEFKSSLFGFVDDLEFRLTEDDIQLRSASRVGHSDAGVNAERVAELRAKLVE